MCRWMAYSGEAVPLELFLFKPEHNLIDQSMSSRSTETPTNGDGFGIGWYGSRENPGLFRSIRPAWNDFNLRDLAAQIDTRLFLAHVRATSLATVQETNCHPFRWRKWLFVHNGEIFDVEKMPSWWRARAPIPYVEIDGVDHRIAKRPARVRPSGEPPCPRARRASSAAP